MKDGYISSAYLFNIPNPLYYMDLHLSRTWDLCNLCHSLSGVKVESFFLGISIAGN